MTASDEPTPDLATPPDSIERIVYLGTPAMAVPPLLALHEAGFGIPLVVSRADKRRGRGGDLTPSPVKAAAMELGIPVTTEVADVLEVEADLGVVVAFGRLIKPDVLARLAMVNLHFSLLPRWRGAAPVERALLEGDAETGVCLMALEEGLDTGGVYRRVVTPIDEADTADDLRRRLVSLGADLVVDALRTGLGEPEPQVGEATYAAKLSADDYRLDPNRPARLLLRTIRMGKAWAEFRGKRLRIWDAELVDDPVTPSPGAFDGLILGTGDGALRLVEVQPEGKGRMAADAWANGARPSPDDRLS